MRKIQMDSKFKYVVQYCIDSYVGLHQPKSCPDIKFTIDSTTESITIKIWMHGYLSNITPDYNLYLDNESSSAEIGMVESLLKLCVTLKEIYLRNFENNG